MARRGPSPRPPREAPPGTRPHVPRGGEGPRAARGRGHRLGAPGRRGWGRRRGGRTRGAMRAWRATRKRLGGAAYVCVSPLGGTEALDHRGRTAALRGQRECSRRQTHRPPTMASWEYPWCGIIAMPPSRGVREGALYLGGEARRITSSVEVRDPQGISRCPAANWARSGRSERPARSVYRSWPARSSAQAPEEHDGVVSGGVGRFAPIREPGPYPTGTQARGENTAASPVPVCDTTHMVARN